MDPIFRGVSPTTKNRKLPKRMDCLGDEEGRLEYSVMVRRVRRVPRSFSFNLIMKN